MVMDLFDTLLEEFSKVVDIPHLKADQNHSCLIALPNGPKIQLEIDPSNTYFIIGSELGFLPTGRYREMVLKEALKANSLPHPHYGDFAFSKKIDNLILFGKLNLHELNGSKIASFYGPFAEKATRWKEAIDRGEVPSIQGELSTRRGGGMFGL